MDLGFRLERLLTLTKREFKLRISYRLTAILTLVGALAGLFSYGFLGNTALVSSTTQTYGMSLSAYLVSGVAFGSIVNNGIGMFYQYGTQVQVEEVLAAPMDFREFLLSSAFFEILLALGSAALLFGLGALLLGLSYTPDFLVLAGAVLLGLLSSIGLGLIGLGVQLVFKQTYVLSWLFFSFSGIIGNMLVPVQILPGFLQAVSYLTPQYYFFTSIRVGLGARVAPATELLEVFGLYTVILLTVGFAALEYGLSYARRNGTLRWQ